MAPEDLQAAVEQSKVDALKMIQENDKIESLYLFLSEKGEQDSDEYQAVTNSVSIINQFQGAAIILEIVESLPSALILALHTLHEKEGGIFSGLEEFNEILSSESADA